MKLISFFSLSVLIATTACQTSARTIQSARTLPMPGSTLTIEAPPRTIEQKNLDQDGNPKQVDMVTVTEAFEVDIKVSCWLETKLEYGQSFTTRDLKLTWFEPGHSINLVVPSRAPFKGFSSVGFTPGWYSPSGRRYTFSCIRTDTREKVEPDVNKILFAILHTETPFLYSPMQQEIVPATFEDDQEKALPGTIGI